MEVCSIEGCRKVKLPALWIVARSLGRLKLVQWTIAVPLVGYLILFNETLVGHLGLSSSVTGISPHTSGLSQGATFRLICIYFGLTFLGIGSVLFMVFCPTIIREHESAQSFTRDELDLLTFATIQKFAAEHDALTGGNSVNSFNQIVEEHVHYISVIEAIDYSLPSNVSPTEARLRIQELLERRRRRATNLLRDLFTVTAHSRRAAAWTILTFFALGLLFLSIPGIWLFCRVLLTFTRIAVDGF